MHLYKKLAVRLTAGLLAVSALSTSAFAVSGTVNADGGLRLREGSNTYSSILTTLANGSTVDILGQTDTGWYQVTAGGQTGFVSGEYLVVDEAQAASLDTVSETKYGRVTAGELNIRSGAGTGYEKTGSLSQGEIVEVLGWNDGWYQIEGGYVISDYLAIVDASELATLSSKGQDIADCALQYLGCPYVYGGSSPSGFDCSGFVRYVLSQMGISVNRTATAQLSNGTPVSRSELQPGDLVFFSNTGSTTKASHVGIYIGNNQFIHASTPSTGVIIDSLSNSYHSSIYMCARRVA